MTAANALFVLAGTALMVLIEWGRHRFEQWWNNRKEHR